MKFRSFLGVVLAICASVLLGSCGGGGATPAANSGATLLITPASAFFYAGIPATFQIVGGRPPFTITSSEPSLFPVPSPTNNGSITVLPQNPSVIDAGLPAGSVPSRSVNIDVHDAVGAAATATFHIQQNFLTGYGFSFIQTSCSTPGATPPTGTTGVQGPTAGCDTVVQVTTSVNGNLHANQTFRFDVVLGNFQVVDPNTGVASTSVTTTTDHNGIALVIIRVPSGANTQVAVFRITDVASGASTTEAFNIAGTNNNTLTAVPSSFTFTGALSTQCGTGSGTFFVFGGTPPYMAASSDPNISVTSSSSTQPGSFTVTANNPNVCSSNATIVVTDSVGQHTTVTVSTVAGSQSPPAPAAFTVAPTSLTLACGQSGSVTAVGGSGSYSATASNTDLTAVVGGSTITITRALHDGGAPAFPASQTVNITDGATIQTVTVTVPPTCP